MKQQIIEWGAYAARAGLVTARSGNLSARDGERVLITASGSFLGRLKDEDIVHLGDPGGRRPSMEADMHRLLLEKIPEAGSVFHSQPPHATLFACTGEPVPLEVIPESMAYVSSVVRIPYLHPGSRGLADTVAERLGIDEIGILENHGLIVAARSVEDAVLITETFEWLCRLVWMARAAGMPLQVLPDGTSGDLHAHLARIRAVSRA